MGNKNLIIFTDIGDTIVDESTEVKKERGLVLRAELIPGAKETLLRLYEAGFTIVMVADGLEQSFRNTLTQHDILKCFSGFICSENVGYFKPSRHMFQAALEEMNLTDADKKRIIMVGNNADRDTVGANRFGITSVQIEWSPRYKYDSKRPIKTPAYRISKPEELWDLVMKLEENLKDK